MKEQLNFLLSIGAIINNNLLDNYKTCYTMQACLHINLLCCAMLLGLLMQRCKLSTG